jgi:hypothetical protein
VATSPRKGSPVSEHVFVSYSRDDSVYVNALVAHLRAAGLPVWVDHEVHYGDRWLKEIAQQIDTCAVVVAVMSPSAENSVWVERELARAEAKNKPIMPLLLAGNEFFRLSGVQYEDVRDSRMPRSEYVAGLRQLVGLTAAAPTSNVPAIGPPVVRQAAPQAMPPYGSAAPLPKARSLGSRRGVLVATMITIATACVVSIAIGAGIYAWDRLSSLLVGAEPTDPATIAAPATPSTSASPETTAVPPTTVVPRTNAAPPTTQPSTPGIPFVVDVLDDISNGVICDSVTEYRFRLKNAVQTVDFAVTYPTLAYADPGYGTLDPGKTFIVVLTFDGAKYGGPFQVGFQQAHVPVSPYEKSFNGIRCKSVSPSP